ncbi:MAG: glucokinase [Caldilineae bacterium]|nr:MAG: glucokinase [Caldilineae bacterium]
MLLAGDIGGTKTILALYSPEQGPRKPLVQKRFASQEYPSLATVVQSFLQEYPHPIERACFGVAGPVIEGTAEITNLPWVIGVRNLQEILGIEEVFLLNDLEAVANAVPVLTTEDLYTLKEGVAVPGGAIAVIAPGTGLGEAYLTWDGRRYRAHASEGGHVDFAPRNAVEMELLRYLLQRYDHVSYERVCSGKGIPNIYHYLKDSGYAGEPPWLAEALLAADDPTPVIVAAALGQQPHSELCEATLEMFASILAAEAGNLALKVLSTGGVYIGGGIPPRILPVLDNQRFLQSFLRKGRFTDFLIRMPLYVIVNEQAALIGAARHGLVAWDGA